METANDSPGCGGGQERSLRLQLAISIAPAHLHVKEARGGRHEEEGTIQQASAESVVQGESKVTTPVPCCVLIAVELPGQGISDRSETL
jgi:hypothetical protein